MTPVKIAVRGAHTVTVRPEQATVHATLSAEGPEAEPVFRTVSVSAAQVSDSLESRLHRRSGPVVRFAVDQIRMGSRRPFNPDGTQLPLIHTAVVSVTAGVVEPRYPSFKGIMAAKSKPVDEVTVADLGLDAGQVGWAGAGQQITDVAQAEARQAGTIVEDDGEGFQKIVDFLAELKVI